MTVGWEALLSNGEVFQGGDISSWRTLKKKCDAEKIDIKALLRDGKEVDGHMKALSYFIIYDQRTSLSSGKTRIRICFGSFRENGKARLQWEVISDTMHNGSSGNVTEIVTEINAVWQEISIPIERGNNYNEVVELHLEERGS